MPFFEILRNDVLLGVGGGSEAPLFFMEISGSRQGPIGILAQGYNIESETRDVWIDRYLFAGDRITLRIKPDDAFATVVRNVEPMIPTPQHRHELYFTVALNGSEVCRSELGELSCLGLVAQWQAPDSVVYVAVSTIGEFVTLPSVGWFDGELVVGDVLELRIDEE